MGTVVDRTVTIGAARPLRARLTVPDEPVGLVVVATAGPGGQYGTIETDLRDALLEVEVATVVCDLLSRADGATDRRRDELARMCTCLDHWSEWLETRERLFGLDTVLCGVGTAGQAVIDYGVTVQAELSGVVVINGRISDDDAATRLAVPLFVFVDSDREFLVEANLGMYRSAGIAPASKWFLNTDWSAALDVLTRWLRRRSTDTTTAGDTQAAETTVEKLE